MTFIAITCALAAPFVGPWNFYLGLFLAVIAFDVLSQQRNAQIHSK